MDVPRGHPARLRANESLLCHYLQRLEKEKRLIGDSGRDSKEVLVENKIEMSDQIEVTSRDCHQRGAFGSGSDAGLCLVDSASGAKQKDGWFWGLTLLSV